MEEVVDFGFTAGGSVRGELTEVLKDLWGFEVDAFDFVIGAAPFDGGPFDDVGGSGAHGVAHVGLLEDFVGARAGAAVLEELGGGEAGALDAINDIEEAGLDGVRDGDAKVDVPRCAEGRFLIFLWRGYGGGVFSVGWGDLRGLGRGGAGFASELVEEGVLAVMGGPDGEVEAPGDAALGGFPEEAGIGMFGEFIEADVACVDGHGAWTGRESDDAGAVVEFDEADFDFFGKASGLAFGIEAGDLQGIFSV